MHQKPVLCLAKMREYSKTFHLMTGEREGGKVQHGWEELEAQLFSKACVLHVQHGVDQFVRCLQRTGERGGQWQRLIKNKQSGERTGTRLVPMGRAHPEIGDKSSGASAICMPCIKSMDFWWGQQFELTGSLWQSPCPLNPRWQSHTVRS